MNPYPQSLRGNPQPGGACLSSLSANQCEKLPAQFASVPSPQVTDQYLTLEQEIQDNSNIIEKLEGVLAPVCFAKPGYPDECNQATPEQELAPLAGGIRILFHRVRGQNARLRALLAAIEL